MFRCPLLRPAVTSLNGGVIVPCESWATMDSRFIGQPTTRPDPSLAPGLYTGRTQVTPCGDRVISPISTRPDQDTHLLSRRGGLRKREYSSFRGPDGNTPRLVPPLVRRASRLVSGSVVVSPGRWEWPNTGSDRRWATIAAPGLELARETTPAPHCRWLSQLRRGRYRWLETARGLSPIRLIGRAQ